MRLPKGLSIVEHNGVTIAKLYDTKIVVIDSTKGIATLNTNGWLTKHTKKCMNLVLGQLGLSVIQRDFKWYVVNNKVTQGHNKSVFHDNMELRYV